MKLHVVLLFALSSIALGKKCDIKCPKKGYGGTLKTGQCACSPGFPGKYPHKSECTIRLSVNKQRRVKLIANEFKFRPSKQCNLEGLKFFNRMNSKKKIYYMSKVCNKNKLRGKKYFMVNSPQVMMKFYAKAKGNRNNKKWRVCLSDPYSKSHERLSCPLTMEKMEKGYNRRHANISSDPKLVTKFCCTATGLSKYDESKITCEEDSFPKANIESNGKEACVTCASSRKRVAVSADIVTPSASKKIQCTCTQKAGAAVGEDCTGGVPCLDLNHNAYCDVKGDNTCKCPKGMITDPKNTYCAPAVPLGADCSKGEVCASTYKRSTCNGTTCVCPSDFQADSTGKYCTKDVPIGQDCSNGLGCIDQFSRATCVKNVCACPSGTIADPTKAYCTKNSNYNGACIDTLDCTKTRSKKCDKSTSKCVCESPFIYFKSICSYKSPLGKVCATTNDCSVTNSVCSGGKCVCRNNYKQRNTGCAPVCTQINGKSYFSGQELCNKKGKTCFKCKCQSPPKKLTYKAKKPSCGKLKCPITTKIGGGSKCGS